MKKCEKCGAEYDKEYIFCPACGGDLTDVPDRCPNCGLELTANYKFCPKCGTAIDPKVSQDKKKETIVKSPEIKERSQDTSQVVAEKPTKSKTKKYVIIGCAAIVVIFAFAYAQISSPQPIFYDDDEEIVIEAGDSLPVEELKLECDDLTQEELNNLEWDATSDEGAIWVEDGIIKTQYIPDYFEKDESGRLVYDTYIEGIAKKGIKSWSAFVYITVVHSEDSD